MNIYKVITCTIEEKDLFISQEVDQDGNEVSLICDFSIGTYLYQYRNGELKNILANKKELGFIDLDVAKVEYERVIDNFKNSKYATAVSKFFDNGGSYTIRPDYIQLGNLIYAVELRKLYPTKTMYYNNLEYPKLIN